jgi:hypothetical protein
MRDMINKIDFKFLVFSLMFLSLGVLTLSGTIQNYVHFQDPLNEMGFAFLGFFGGVLFALGIKK